MFAVCPENCGYNLTGLTDKMRSDFGIMKDLSSHTRLNPQQREERLNRFVATFQK